MPQFYAGESKTAKVTMSNPTAKDFSYSGVLFLGLPEVVRSEVDFSIPAGVSKEVSFPITMPSQVGVYPVYLSVFSAGQLLAQYQATEDVEIVVLLPFDMAITQIATTTDKYAPAYWLMRPTALVSNPHSIRITHRLKFIVAPGARDKNLLSSYLWTRCWGGGTPGTPENQLYELSVALDPGQSITLVSPFYYINGWNDSHNNYEWSNMPPGMYSAGEPKKYWFRLIDEQGNWSPVKSVGSA